MNIDFGTVKKYFADRGFGFVTHTFLSGKQKEVFFHIKNVKRAHPELAERLDSFWGLESVHFWYETEVTNKGEQVRAIIKSESVHDRIADDLIDFVSKVEDMWLNLGVAVPSWLYDVTVDLIGIEQALELRSKRAALEEDRRKINVRERKEQDFDWEIEEENWQELIDEQSIQEDIEEKEFEQLVNEMTPLGFTESAEVSAYIVKNKLGYKYKNISGILEMELDGNTWNFKGGFPPKIYARLCQELGLDNRGSQAKPGRFESFKELSDKHHY